MDGVIVDSEPIHHACEKKIFDLLGLRITDEEHNTFMGTTDETMWHAFNAKYNLPVNVNVARQLKKSLYMESLKQNSNIKPIPHVSRVISGLYEKGFLLVLASSSPQCQIDYILEKFSFKRFFHSSLSGDDVSKGKPHPEIFLKAAETLGLSPEFCIVIEDSANGTEAAKKAGMRCIGYEDTNFGKQDLSSADMVIRSFSDLLDGSDKFSDRFLSLLFIQQKD